MGDDVVNSGFPFFDLFECGPDESCDGGRSGYTHGDVLYWTSPERTPYTYDTLEHLYCEEVGGAAAVNGSSDVQSWQGFRSFCRFFQVGVDAVSLTVISSLASLIAGIAMVRRRSRHSKPRTDKDSEGIGAQGIAASTA